MKSKKQLMKFKQIKNRVKSLRKIPLKFFESLEGLYPIQRKYLEEYSRRIKIGKGNSALLEKIGIILLKPSISNPIDSYDYSINYNKYKKTQKVTPKETINEPKKESLFQRISRYINFIGMRIIGCFKWSR